MKLTFSEVYVNIYAQRNVRMSASAPPHRYVPVLNIYCLVLRSSMLMVLCESTESSVRRKPFEVEEL